MTILWVAIFVIFIIIEAITVNFFTFWLALGALCAAIASLVFSNVYIEAIVFLFATIMSLILSKPLIDKWQKQEKLTSGAKGHIGKIGIVSEAILEDEVGEVKLNGIPWSAISKEEIVVGTKVKVIGLDGVKLIVERKEK